MAWTPELAQCAAAIAPATLRAIVRIESAFNPLAININGRVRLQRQPQSADEAASWARWLIERGHSVDLGLAQINSTNLPSLGLTPEAAFDPCRNLQAAALLLTRFDAAARRVYGNSPALSYHILSAYNTGSFTRGLSNGYVDRVVSAAAAPPPLVPLAAAAPVSAANRTQPTVAATVGATRAAAEPTFKSRATVVVPRMAVRTGFNARDRQQVLAADSEVTAFAPPP